MGAILGVQEREGRRQVLCGGTERVGRGREEWRDAVNVWEKGVKRRGSAEGRMVMMCVSRVGTVKGRSCRVAMLSHVKTVT